MTDELDKRLSTIEQQLALLLNAIVVQQKDACQITGITPETVRNKAERGEVNILQFDGSRRNFVTLQDASSLKVRSPKKRNFRRNG